MKVHRNIKRVAIFNTVKLNCSKSISATNSKYCQIKSKFLTETYHLLKLTDNAFHKISCLITTTSLIIWPTLFRDGFWTKWKNILQVNSQFKLPYLDISSSEKVKPRFFNATIELKLPDENVSSIDAKSQFSLWM